MKRAIGAFSLALIVAGPGCRSIGSHTIRGDRFDYNEAGVESAKEQLLLNVVRLRYGEPIYFVEVTSMLSQFSIEATGSMSGWHNDLHGAYGPAVRAAYGLRGDASRETTIGGNLHYSDTPTITYRPLQGEEFSRRVLAPIPPSVIVYLSQSGWSIDRLLSCCVQRINDISNRELQDTLADKTPDGSDFARLVALMKKVQDSGRSAFSIETENGVPTAVLSVPATIPGLDDEIREVRKMLGYPLEGQLYLRVTSKTVQRAPDELAMQTRSVLGAMYALAQECVVPPEHIKSQEAPEMLCNPNNGPDGKWMRIETSRLPQLDAFAQVFYDGHWFYIAKSDWSSKRTFALLTYLFSLQASDNAVSLPVVTVPTGK